MAYAVRRVRPDDWPALRAMRLEALQDPAAPLAYLETYEQALARPESFWQERTAEAAAGVAAVQYAAFDAGRPIASVSALREEQGSADFAGQVIAQLQAHVVGVWIDPAHRGVGLLGQLVGEVERWASWYGTDRLRLLVHAENARAQAAYRKIGFVPTGVSVQLAAGTEIEMVLRRD